MITGLPRLVSAPASGFKSRKGSASPRVRLNAFAAPIARRSSAFPNRTSCSLVWQRCLGCVKLPAAWLAAAIIFTAFPTEAVSVLSNKPALSSDYASVVRKREGKSKSALPSSKEAEALLEINEDMFTTEALEGMSRCLASHSTSQIEQHSAQAAAALLAA